MPNEEQKMTQNLRMFVGWLKSSVTSDPLVKITISGTSINHDSSDDDKTHGVTNFDTDVFLTFHRLFVTDNKLDCIEGWLIGENDENENNLILIPFSYSNDMAIKLSKEKNSFCFGIKSIQAGLENMVKIDHEEFPIVSGIGKDLIISENEKCPCIKTHQAKLAVSKSICVLHRHYGNVELINCLNKPEICEEKITTNIPDIMENLKKYLGQIITASQTTVKYKFNPGPHTTLTNGNYFINNIQCSDKKAINAVGIYSDLTSKFTYPPSMLKQVKNDGIIIADEKHQETFIPFFEQGPISPEGNWMISYLDTTTSKMGDISFFIFYNNNYQKFIEPQILEKIQTYAHLVNTPDKII